MHRHSTGLTVMRHPIVGRLELPCENFALPADPELSMMTYNPEPGTPAGDAIKLLQSWAADRQGPRVRPAVEPAESDDHPATS